jgi:hypothetical protein
VADISALERRMGETAAAVAAIYQRLVDRPAAEARITLGDETPH